MKNQDDQFITFTVKNSYEIEVVVNTGPFDCNYLMQHFPED